MGAFEAGSFENDDAMDWLGEFCDAPSLKFVEKTLRAASGGGYIEAPEAGMAIAAAEVVAALKNAPVASPPKPLREFLAENTLAAERSLVELAMQAVAKVKADSELKELWEDDGADEWLSGVEDLEKRLKK